MEWLKIFFNVLKWTYNHTIGIRSYRLNREFISFCKDRNLKGVESALVKGANINFKDEHGKPALIIASSVDEETETVPKGSFDLVNLLLRYGREGRYRIKIDARDNKGNTALIMAARNGQSRIVKLLIDNGANVNAKNNEGYTALMRADKHGYDDTGDILRDNGAR